MGELTGGEEKSRAIISVRAVSFTDRFDDVIIGPGSKELIFQTQLVSKGDLILPSPSWVSYEPQAQIINKKVHWIKTSAETNWHLEPEELDKTCDNLNSVNKLLILNSPNNPSWTTHGNLKEFANVAKKHNIIIIADEIYAELDFTGEYKSITHHYPEQTIVSSGLSKWCGAGGWRLGYFLIPDNLLDIKNMINVLASETFSAVSAPIQYAAIKAYENDHSNYINKSKNILGAIGNYVYENLRSNKVLINKPQGGFYLMPEFLNKKYNSSSEMCDSILNDTGVALLPGSDFGFDQKQMLARLSFTDFNGQKFMNEIKDNEKINIENIELNTIYTPGHTDCSYSFLMKDRVFTGDTLLINGTGRTDFQSGSPYAVSYTHLTLPTKRIV